MTVRPDSTILLKTLTTDSAMNESKPVVGSSANNTDGIVDISEAIFNLLRSPPEIPLQTYRNFDLEKNKK